jgi:hypothetical protein
MLNACTRVSKCFLSVKTSITLGVSISDKEKLYRSPFVNNIVTSPSECFLGIVFCTLLL